MPGWRGCGCDRPPSPATVTSSQLGVVNLPFSVPRILSPSKESRSPGGSPRSSAYESSLPTVRYLLRFAVIGRLTANLCYLAPNDRARTNSPQQNADTPRGSPPSQAEQESIAISVVYPARPRPKGEDLLLPGTKLSTGLVSLGGLLARSAPRMVSLLSASIHLKGEHPRSAPVPRPATPEK